MISKNCYEQLRSKYWDVASWAIWAPCTGAPKSNMGNLSVFDDPDLLKKLNNRFILVGLNGSGVHDAYLEFSKAWYNFHSDYPRGNDFKMRYAFKDTPVWGSYITDFIKYFQEVDSSKAVQYIRNNPQAMRKNVDAFKDELALLGGSPVIVALGGASYKLIKENLGDSHRIVMIKHYSYTIGKEDYRKEALEVLSPFF